MSARSVEEDRTGATDSVPPREEGGKGRVGLGPGREFDLIRSVLEGSASAGSGVRVGPGDDALVLVGGVVVSCDLSIEDVHFRRSWLTLREAGFRAAAAALSDLAAMASDVEGALVAIAAPGGDGGESVTELAAGAREAVEAVGGVLLGGDLSSSPGPAVVDVVALGRVEEPVSRAGAVAGDTLWVTGSLGGAGAAVRRWERGGAPDAGAREAFARPSPRIREARWLAEAVGMHALIDLSDGLAGDAGHLAAASGVRVVLLEDRLPLHPSVESVGDGDPEVALDLALHAGEDYELLFAAPADSVEAARSRFRRRFGISLTRVGRVEEGAGVFLEGRDGENPIGVDRGGYDHFVPGGSS